MSHLYRLGMQTSIPSTTNPIPRNQYGVLRKPCLVLFDLE